MKFIYLLLLASCTSNTHKSNLSYVSDDLNKTNYGTRELLIAPLTKQGAVLNNGSYAIHKNGDDSLFSSEKILAYFNTNLGKVMNSYVKNNNLFSDSTLYSKFVNEIADSDMVKIELPLGEYGVKYSFKIFNENFLKKHNITNKIIFIISTYEFDFSDKREVSVYHPGGTVDFGHNITSSLPSGHKCGGMHYAFLEEKDNEREPAICWTAKLSSFLRYVVWDYERNVPLTYGQVNPNNSDKWKSLKKIWKIRVNNDINQLKLSLPQIRFFKKCKTPEC